MAAQQYSKARLKYLSLYAESESQAEALQPLLSASATFDHGLVIPIYKESTSVLQCFCRFAEQRGKTLIIMVLNRPDSDPDTQWAKTWLEQLAELHAELYKELHEEPHEKLHEELQPELPAKLGASIDHPQGATPLHLLDLQQGSALLLIDRAIHGTPIPCDQGVGLARKIGADILCQLIHLGCVQSPWIFNTDADATLPENYFAQSTRVAANIAALIYPFRHVFVDQTPLLPTLLYEFSLRYYVAGLQWAASPYGYHTIGSIMAVHFDHYAKVRGFPKRSGAEDFYLLNKLAKTGAIVDISRAQISSTELSKAQISSAQPSITQISITQISSPHQLTTPIIELQARASTRVPFGTGPAVLKLAAQDHPLAMPLYHPDCFAYLRFFLQLLGALAQHSGSIERQTAALKKSARFTLDVAPLLEVAQVLQLPKALAHSNQQGNTAAARLRHLTQWFDGFKTLKFIHWLRDHHLPSVSYQQWQSTHASHLEQPQPNTAMMALMRRIKDGND